MITPELDLFTVNSTTNTSPRQDETQADLAIAVQELTHRYGRGFSLGRDGGLELWVRRGQVVGLLGPNGAGKSTLMRILAGLQPFRSGKVVVDGLDVGDQADELRPRVGYLPESVPLYTEMRVREYLKFRARLKRVDATGRSVAEWVDEVMERCDLTGRHRALIRRLSKGYRQRVGLADLLLARPKVLLLDEPTSGLDPRQIARFRDLVHELKQEATVLWSSHIVGELEQRCDSVVVLVDGEIRARVDLGERSGGLYLEVGDAPKDLREQLEAAGGIDEVVPQGSGWWVRGSAEDLAARVMAALPSGSSVLELRSGVRYLERVYLSATAPEGEPS